MSPTLKKTLPPVVDTSENLLASTKLIKDGQIVKIAGSILYKVGTGNKTFAELAYIIPSGGNHLDILVKNSAADGDVAWAELDLSEYASKAEVDAMTTAVNAILEKLAHGG